MFLVIMKNNNNHYFFKDREVCNVVENMKKLSYHFSFSFKMILSKFKVVFPQTDLIKLVQHIRINILNEWSNS